MSERDKMVREYRLKERDRRIMDRDTLRWARLKAPILCVAFLVILVYLLAQMRHWQEFAGDAYVIRTMNQVMNRHSAGDGLVAPIRGSISDRNFQTLALSSITYNIIVDLRNLYHRGENERAHNRQILTEFFGMGFYEADALMQRRDTHHFIIERGVPYSRTREFEDWVALRHYEAQRDERRFFTRDIAFIGTSQRSYMHGNLASPILGFYHGYWWGLEHEYNLLLSGQDGRNMTVFGPDGHITTQRIPPVHGGHVITTLDLNFQRFAEQEVVRWAELASAAHGSIIVMNPHTGEILTMAQYPSFDGNNPSLIEGLTTQNTAHFNDLAPGSQEFFDELFRIWANFNITATFEPGSIYKSFTAAKALDMGVIGFNQMFYCYGFIERAGLRIGCWRRHGQINLTQAIAQSCNMAHIEIAEALGREAFWHYQRDFGFGTITGIDLPGENPGLVFSINELNATELATSSFGQRFTASPIQSIAAFAALINGGYVVRPHVVSQILADDGTTIFSQNTARQRAVIAPEISDWMRRAMAYTITDGTAQGAAIEGFTQGGKTATAEQGLMDAPDFTWSLSYIGYFPLENPRYIIQVILHEIPPEVYDGGFTSVVPMFRSMAMEIIRLRAMTPCTAVEAAGIFQESELVENLVGLSVQEAINLLNAMGRAYIFSGSGNFVASQFPPAGVRAMSETPVVLHLGDDGTVPLIPVPDVIGQPVDFAREILIQSGFTPRVSYLAPAADAATVHEQTGQGLSLPRYTDILIKVR
jgi:stage V sporulation protein D (sporulation-specific penicillin-binding protein)